MLESQPVASPVVEHSSNASAEPCDVLILALAGGEPFGRTLQAVDARGDGWVQRMVDDGNLTGKRGEVVVLGPSGDASIVAIVGIGPADELSRDGVFDATSTAVRRFVDRPRNRIVLAVGESVNAEFADNVVAGAIFACEGHSIYQSEPAKTNAPRTLAFADIDGGTIKRGQAVANAMNQTRRLVNEPPSVIYPESFARRAVELADEVGLEAEVWDENRLDAENCRAILAVGRASARPPRLVILRHNGGDDDQPPLAIVGKGVTFDSGGLSLKPSEAMIDMKCDMAGAATVVGVMHAVAKLGVKRNVIGLCGLAENMISGDAYKLGDVIETRSGKTVEILNTDAEGRVVLADTLDVAVEQKPAAIVDLATLTGACLVALGKEVAGLMTNNQDLCDELRKAADTEGEPAWQLPMFKLYDDKIKSRIASIKNVGESRWGGAITAAKFLEQFVGETPWVHIDIAGPAYADSPKPHRDGGATGAMVRTLVHWINQH